VAPAPYRSRGRFTIFVIDIEMSPDRAVMLATLNRSTDELVRRRVDAVENPDRNRAERHDRGHLAAKAPVPVCAPAEGESTMRVALPETG
jgi:hypothetical protein